LRERRNLGGCNWDVIGALAGDGRLEEDRGGESESLEVWVEELSIGENPRSFEGMACNPCWMCVI
jgi:hypothetical protein